MEPISFENSTKLQCFAYLVSKWKYCSNYWTSGSRVNNSDFSWCKKKGLLEVQTPMLPWATGEPQNVNNSENCLQLKVLRENAAFLFSDRMCTDMQFFACQGPPTPAPCSTPVCPNVTCAKNPQFYAAMGSSQYLQLPSDHGQWFTYSERMYLFSSTNKIQTYVGAMQACCEVGMNLLSLQYDYKYKSIIQAIKENVSSSDLFWTSGSDRGCESKFGYCTANKLLRREAIWAPGQPDNAGGNESAVVVFINSSSAQLFDYNEQSKLRYICEARDNSRPNTGGTSVMDECASIFNVSKIEIDSLFNPNITKDIRIKCFVKCVGESSGLMVNGQFVGNEVLAILENMFIGNSVELQNNIDIMEECENKSFNIVGMDECDRAAQMIKCCSEKAPVVLSGIISAMDQLIPLEKAPLLSPPAACVFDPSACTLNTVLAQEVANCLGNCTTRWGFVRNLCGKKYYHDISPVSLGQGYINCCVHGLKLASIESAKEVNCLTNLNTPIAGAWTWVSASRVNSTFPRWCTSNASFSFAGFDNVTNDPNPIYDSYAILPNTKQISNKSPDQAFNPLCQVP
ncbi:uncharacterized protein LOC132200699 [Neocloeon triangulifer]|uniref:uncharacterized protein LOC132200699 n=1 Tax=Neocloeon triangulifer TaxID=2078957 RepID=UPI00286F41C3|nr:uncharacterized protein LOC132200699 [Neocloeon triangulifer]